MSDFDSLLLTPHYLADPYAAYAELRGRIESVFDDLLDTFDIDLEVDQVRQLAYPLPAIVVCEMLGIPTTDRSRFHEWADDLSAFLGSFRALTFSTSTAIPTSIWHSAWESTSASAPLARVEGEFVFSKMLMRFPNLRLAPREISWRVDTSQRCLTELWMTTQA